jgi:hypothetical protein
MKKLLDIKALQEQIKEKLKEQQEAQKEKSENLQNN